MMLEVIITRIEKREKNEIDPVFSSVQYIIYTLSHARCVCNVFAYFFTIQSPNDYNCNCSSYIFDKIQQIFMFSFSPPLVAAIMW